MRKLFALVGITLLLTGCLGSRGEGQDVADGSAPYFQLEDLDGNTWSTQGLKGKVGVLYFWRASCPPCIAKLPDLHQLQLELPEDVILLLVNLDDSVQRLNQLTQDYPELIVLKNARNTFVHYGINFTPTTVFINRDGEIVESRIGGMSNQEMKDLINQLR